MNGLAREMKQALRRLRRAPVVASVVIVTLAAVIGATMAVYTVTERVLVRLLPFDEPDRLVVLWETNPSLGRSFDQVAPPNFLDWRRSARSFDSMAAFMYDATTLTNVEEPAQLSAVRQTTEMFSVLGARAALGRVFLESEGEPGRSNVVVLSNAVWQSVFGGDPSIVGRAISLDGVPHEIVGVMPAEYAFPDEDAQLWLPLPIGPEAADMRATRALNVVARLGDGVSPATARAELDSIAQRLEEDYPETNRGWRVSVVPAVDQLTRDVRPVLLAMMAAVVVVLLIACANLASLLAVRTAERAKEFAVRSALGAGRARVATHTMAESMLLALIGGVLGLALAELIVRVLVGAGREVIPFAYRVHVDAQAVIVGLGLSLLVGFVLGIAPALSSSKVNMNELRVSGTTTGNRLLARLISGLVVGQVALALALAIGASLLIQSVVKLYRVDPGFEASEVLSARINLPRAQYPRSEDSVAFFTDLLERVRALPGVMGAGAVTALPLSQVGIDFDLPVELVGRPVTRAGEDPQADFRVVTAGYFEAMRMPIVGGRGLEERDSRVDRREGDQGAQDGRAAPAAMVVNETMARQFWGGADPVGERVRIPMGGEYEIVGVVADVRHRGLDQVARPEMYVPLGPVSFANMTLAVRVQGDPQALIGALRQAVRDIDPNQPLADIKSMDAIVTASMSEASLSARLATGLAFAAILLAALGLYGVSAYAVSIRRREIGLRMAMGASRSTTVSRVVGKGMVIAAIGLAAGLILSVWTSRAIAGLLFETPPFDVTTFSVVALLLIGVMLMANVLPGYRAASIDPARVLRDH